MSTETWDPNAAVNTSAEVSMTDAAIEHISKQLAQMSDAKGIRLGLKKSGCSGFKYELDFVNETPEADQVIKINDTLTLFIPQDAVAVLGETVIDYTTEGLNSSIKFLNPKAKDLCGCGESFSA